MESLVGYASDDENGDYEVKKDAKRRSNHPEMDDNYDNVQMDMSEDSNMDQSSDTSSDSSSDEETNKGPSKQYSDDEDMKNETVPRERKKSEEITTNWNSKEERTTQKFHNRDSSDDVPLERKEKFDEWKERTDERKYRPEVKCDMFEQGSKKLEEKKRLSDDSSKQDERRDSKSRRDESSRNRDQKNKERHSSKDRDRESKSSYKDKDCWDRGDDRKYKLSRDSNGKDSRKVDSYKDDRRSSRRSEERRSSERKEDRKSHDRQSDRYGDDKKDKKRDDRKDKARREGVSSKRERSRSPRRLGTDDKIKRMRSRSPSNRLSTKSRSPLSSDRKTGDKRGSSPRRNDQKRPDYRRRSRSRDRHSPEARRRSRSRERSMGRLRPYEKKPSKLSILERLGISLPAMSDASGVITPQELVQRSMQAQVQQVKSKTGIELPSYYNPAAMNPARYAEQIQKRRLLWGNKGMEAQEKKAVDNSAASTANKWEGTTFASDQDGKMTAKFKRLMGIKNQAGTSSSGEATTDGNKPEIIKKQEELFSSMEAQYEVARVATHTHRGLGLGFGTFQYPR